MNGAEQANLCEYYDNSKSNCSQKSNGHYTSYTSC